MKEPLSAKVVRLIWMLSAGFLALLFIALPFIEGGFSTYDAIVSVVMGLAIVVLTYLLFSGQSPARYFVVLFVLWLYVGFLLGELVRGVGFEVNFVMFVMSLVLAVLWSRKDVRAYYHVG